MIHDTNGDRRSGNSGRMLRSIGNSDLRNGSFTHLKRSYRRVCLGAAAVVICIACGIGLIRNVSTRANEKRPITYDEAADLSRQLRSLKQSDLIQFEDGRIWYVRNVRGDNMEVVGWVGDNARIEDIPSFVLSEDRFRIVRQSDRDWQAVRDEYLSQ